MPKIIKYELMGNILRPFKKQYSYNETFKTAWNSSFPFIISIILMNIVLITLSIITDTLTLYFEVSYWWGLLIRTPIVLLAIANFAPWQNKALFILDTIILLLSIFANIWSVFLIIYLIVKTYLQTIFTRY